jgi:prepilin-type N-terminal cleavage/methylation domain-containing protein
VSRRLRRDRRGLTLIELVLTLTILALAGSLVSGALVAGLRTWQTGLRNGREEHVARIVLERLAAQVRAAIAAPAKRDGADAVAFDAGEHQLRFVTLAAGGAAPQQVSYRLEEGGGASRLVYREFPWPSKEFFDGERPRREEALPEVTGFSVKAVKRPAESSSPDANGEDSTAAWNPLDKELPGRVEIAISVAVAGEPAARQYEIAVPILSRKEPK